LILQNIITDKNRERFYIFYPLPSWAFLSKQQLLPFLTGNFRKTVGPNNKDDFAINTHTLKNAAAYLHGAYLSMFKSTAVFLKHI
jgi:hypothetical protein